MEINNNPIAAGAAASQISRAAADRTTARQQHAEKARKDGATADSDKTVGQTTQQQQSGDRDPNGGGYARAGKDEAGAQQKESVQSPEDNNASRPSGVDPSAETGQQADFIG